VPELRRDPVVGRWVIISTERARRPSDFPARLPRPRTGPCVLCEGQEDKTPPELWAVRAQGGPPNGPGWQVRVVPNKFPALRIEGDLEPTGEGLYDRMNGVGAHEVIVEAPEHASSFEHLPPEHLATVFQAYQARMLDLAQDRRLEYAMVFKNHGEAAGASLEHTHSQLIATPIVPSMVADEVAGGLQHYRIKQRCIWCDIVRQERQGQTRLIAEDEGYVALAPFAPRFPFETWVLPASHRSSFPETAAGEFLALARLTGLVLRRLGRHLTDPPYNLMLHSAPLKTPALAHFHWHLEITPKLTNAAGFEFGTGFFINPTPPEEAAAYLRDGLGDGG
jgi:UDPglucose--hexose-1-phosphate uridylyltransferase